MAWSWKLIVGGALVAAVVGAAVVALAVGSSEPDDLRTDVGKITTDGRPLRGQPIDLIGVAGRYVGLVNVSSQPWVVTSDDGAAWVATRAVDLPGEASETQAYPGGLNNVAHVLFTDGDTVYLRTRSGSSYHRLGSVSLYASSPEATSWQEVVLPAPPGKGAFPITAATLGGRRFIAGAVFDQVYGRSYLDAALWVADGAGASRRVDSPAFSGDGNQTIFSLEVIGSTVVAGGGDGALVDITSCCFYPDSMALAERRPG